MLDFAHDSSNKSYSLWENFVYSGKRPLSDTFILQQLFFINTFSTLGSLTVVVFGILHIEAHNYTTGIPELIGGSIFLFNLLLLRIHRNIRFARILLLLTQGALLIVQLITGGIVHTGVFWYFTFPVVAFFLTGKKNGLLWIMALYIVTLFFILLAVTNQITLAYSFSEIRQLLVSLCILSILVYIYQNTIEKTESAFEMHMTELEKTKSEFIALASHQLRTPISAIAWFTEILLYSDSKQISEAEQKDNLKQIYLSNQRMADLVDALLQVSQLEMGNLSIHPEYTNLAELSHKTLTEELKKQNVVKDLTVQEQYDENIPGILIDPNNMKIIFRNLFSNAIKYTPAHGTITISITFNQQQATGNKNGVLVTVKDTGYGIPESQKVKIFTKLSRADNIKGKDTDGTGIGLYIVQAIVQEIGGKIWFESVVNTGSTFFVWLPLENT